MRQAKTPLPTHGNPLDALRFVAAVFVVLYHYGSDAPVPLEQFAPVFGRGWLATDFFLLLSGYVLGRAYGARLDDGRIEAGAFVARRLRRVWPAHLLVLAGFAGVVGLAALAGVAPAHPDRFGASDFWLQAALVHAWGFTATPAWNVPSWTLSALAVCYLLFPAAWAAGRPLQRRFAAVVGAGLVMAAGAAFSAAVFGRPLYDLPFQYGVVRAVPLFLAGALLARFLDGRRLPGRVALAAGLVGAGSLAAIASLPRSELADFSAMAATALVVLAADAARDVKVRGAALAAAVSFALFVTHALAGALWFGLARAAEARLSFGEAGSWLLWAGSLPFALGFAWAFNRYVDAPAQAALAGFRPRPGRRPEPARSG